MQISPSKTAGQCSFILEGEIFIVHGFGKIRPMKRFSCNSKCFVYLVFYQGCVAFYVGKTKV